MKLIIRFEDFNKINETSEFNFGRLNSDSGTLMPNVDDPTLSTNAFDKNQSSIQLATNRLNQIIGSLSNTPQLSFLKSKLSLEEQNIISMKILRIIKNNGGYDAYISFVIKDIEYWGVIKDIIGSPDVKSEVFKDSELVLSKEWIIKCKGTIINIVKKFLTPEDGEYSLLKDELFVINTNTGGQFKLNKGESIKVIRSFDSKIVFIHKNEYYQLSGDNYVYFNWWFTKS